MFLIFFVLQRHLTIFFILFKLKPDITCIDLTDMKSNNITFQSQNGCIYKVVQVVSVVIWNKSELDRSMWTMCNVDFQLNLFQSHKVHLPIYLKGFNFFFSSHFFVGNSFNGINPVVPAPPMSVGLHAPLLAPHSDSINTNNPLQPRPGMQNC